MIEADDPNSLWVIKGLDTARTCNRGVSPCRWCAYGRFLLVRLRRIMSEIGCRARGHLRRHLHAMQTVVKKGMKIRLQHLGTRVYLHSHQQHASPLSGGKRYEVRTLHWRSSERALSANVPLCRSVASAATRNPTRAMRGASHPRRATCGYAGRR